ncbi:hypothetical protein [Actinoplanes sp. NPDC023714]|uniref:DUF6929 family protein n=1 Tax=Actinoplanes sp. NPDC023714 TaxID=3154322 RepID=UPI0033D46B1A
MRVVVEATASLRFSDGSPVRAASAIAPFGDGWLVVQDDTTHAAWLRGGTATPIRVIDPVEGLDEFTEAAGTKHLKPDFESACALPDGGVLLLGSGSTAARMRASVVTTGGFTVADRRPVYRSVAATLGIPESQLNLEGACLRDGTVRWFQRGNTAAGIPSASADVPLSALLTTDENQIKSDNPQVYDLSTVNGVPPAITDAVTLPDGRILVSAAAEDTPNAIDDGPVIASALALLDDARVLAVAEIPPGPAGPWKVEGLAVAEEFPGGVRLPAVVDADDPLTPSAWLTLKVTF